MDGRESRRQFLVGSAALAGAASLAHAGVHRAFAQATEAPRKPARFAYYSMRQQVAALAAREVSAVELLDQAINRVEAFDGKINAVVVRDFERARIAAAAADAALARGERRPLLGLPMTVKESFNVGGLPTTWGIPRGRDWRPAEDAVAVARLKAAGAVIFGKTNVPFALADWQSFNQIYGTTNNPWDLSRTPGGSSGGSAAALAAGFTALELGSDIGGLLRTPAHFCGVSAHKPTHGLAPARGQAPPHAEALPVQVDLAVIGPMARSAGDLSLALDVIAGPDEAEAIAYRLTLPPARHSDLRNFRVLVIDTHPLLPTAGAIGSALARLAEGLAKAGVKVAHSSPLLPDLARLTRTYVLLLSSFFGADMPPEAYGRVQRYVGRLLPEDVSLAAERARGVVLSHRDWVRADRVRNIVRRQWRDLFREWDVVLTPPMPTTAFPHDHHESQSEREIEINAMRHRYLDQIVWAGLATLTGLPATVVPIGRSESGLPIGVQIIGPHLEDRTTLRFAELIEREFGGFTPPPGFAD